MEFLERVGPKLRCARLEEKDLHGFHSHSTGPSRGIPEKEVVGAAVLRFCSELRTLDLGFLGIPSVLPSCDDVPEVSPHPWQAHQGRCMYVCMHFWTQIRIVHWSISHCTLDYWRHARL